MDRVAARWTRLRRQTQTGIATAAGIAIGVLLLASGFVPLQIAGGVLVGLGLIVARDGERFPDAWWTEPGTQLVQAYRIARVRVPGWAWPACVSAVVLGLAAIMVRRLFLERDVDRATFGDLGKGLIALAMFASLALWSIDDLPRRIAKRMPWFGRASRDGSSP